MKGIDKTDQDFKVGILYEDTRMYTESEHSESNPAGARKARLLFFFMYFLL